MARMRTHEDTGDRRGTPPLGNGREDELSEEDLGTLGREDGPESQGGFANEDYGAVQQGAYGDEDFDASYQRDAEPVQVDPDAAVSPRRPATSEHEGPGRGLRGGEWASEEPLETPDELTRKVLAEESEERRRDDLAIGDDVVDVVTAAIPDIRELRVAVERGEVTLEGVVADRAAAVEAARLAARIPGVVDVIPRLRVAGA
jgi:hypothetical protein